MAAIVIPGPSPLVYRRRRAVALLVFAGFVIALVTVLGRLGDGSVTVSGPSSGPVAQLVGSSVRVVAPGDTLWSIARQAQPSGDVRPLVEALSAARHGRPLQVGERISLPSTAELRLSQR
jgi:hypothetical protein